MSISYYYPLLPQGLLTVDGEIITGHSGQGHCSLPISPSVQLYIKCFIKQPGKRKWIYLS